MKRLDCIYFDCHFAYLISDLVEDKLTVVMVSNAEYVQKL
jgi:hypothetical protein